MAPVSDQYRITHTTGRARTGHERGGVLAHLVDLATGVALCGARPRRLSSWSEYDDAAITCAKCAHEADELGIEPPAPWWADDEPADDERLDRPRLPRTSARNRWAI